MLPWTKYVSDCWKVIPFVRYGEAYILRIGLLDRNGKLFHPFIVRVGVQSSVHPAIQKIYLDTLLEERLKGEQGPISTLTGSRASTLLFHHCMSLKQTLFTRIGRDTRQTGRCVQADGFCYLGAESCPSRDCRGQGGSPASVLLDLCNPSAVVISSRTSPNS